MRTPGASVAWPTTGMPAGGVAVSSNASLTVLPIADTAGAPRRVRREGSSPVATDESVTRRSNPEPSAARRLALFLELRLLLHLDVRADRDLRIARARPVDCRADELRQVVAPDAVKTVGAVATDLVAKLRRQRLGVRGRFLDVVDGLVLVADRAHELRTRKAVRDRRRDRERG